MDRDEDTRREPDGTGDSGGAGLGSLATPPTAGERVTYRSARVLAKVVTAVLVLDVAAMAVTALLYLDLLEVSRALVAGQAVSQDSIDVISVGYDQTALVTLGVLVVCAVSFCMWTYRVAKNAPAPGRSPSITPGWAVGFYFVPIVSLWMPYQALAAVWDASDPDPRTEGGASRSHGLLLSWWLVWVGSSVVDIIAYSWEVRTADDWVLRSQLGLVATAVEAVAAAFAIVVVWKLTRRQDDRAAALMPTARIA
jgi:Domain of unknown function (DUF4328)